MVLLLHVALAGIILHWQRDWEGRAEKAYSHACQLGAPLHGLPRVASMVASGWLVSYMAAGFQRMKAEAARLLRGQPWSWHSVTCTEFYWSKQVLWPVQVQEEGKQISPLDGHSSMLILECKMLVAMVRD